MNYPTPHINAKPEDFAHTVLMPGDPLRSEFIAKNFFTDARLVNSVRGVQGYTGFYRGTRVSVMASGMGMPSIAIYSYELFHIFNVQNIIRVGSAGSIQPHVNIRDLVLGMGACTDASFASHFGFSGNFSAIADYTLLKTAAAEAEKLGTRYFVGNLYSSDAYYSDDTDSVPALAALGVMAVEMEAAALYVNAAKAGKRALAVCTVSNSILTGVETTAEERQTSFTQMIEVALNTAVSMG